MPEPAPHSRREPEERNRARALAIAGLTGMLIVLVLVITTIGGAAGGDGDSEQAASPAATEAAAATETPEPSATPVPLTEEEKAARQEAIDLVISRDFEVVDKSDWDPDDTLQVLVGRASASDALLAFFFVDGTYLGNDSTELSTKLRVKGTDDVEVVLQYGIYQEGDEPGKPTGEPIRVTFRYEAGVVEPVEALPTPELRLL